MKEEIERLRHTHIPFRHTMSFLLLFCLVALVRTQNTTTSAMGATNETAPFTTETNFNGTTTSTSPTTSTTTLSNTTTTTTTTTTPSNTTNATDGACNVVRFSLLTSFGSSESLVLKNAPCNLTLTLKPNGAFVCSVGEISLLLAFVDFSRRVVFVCPSRRLARVHV